MDNNDPKTDFDKKFKNQYFVKFLAKFYHYTCFASMKENDCT